MTALRPEVADSDRGPDDPDRTASEGTGLVQLPEFDRHRCSPPEASGGRRTSTEVGVRPWSPRTRTCSRQVPEQLRREVDPAAARARRGAREQSLRGQPDRQLQPQIPWTSRLLDMVPPSTRPATAWAIALIDLDWFKQVNDTFGHLLGDRVLQRVVELLQEELPEGGFLRPVRRRGVRPGAAGGGRPPGGGGDRRVGAAACRASRLGRPWHPVCG
ncbi:diguanylate cyclase [Saccharothrix australiensis]|uniref:diguanylate cyclase n=1 Tax=Saccharothrix australiensis TaxID=2072 RepID=UPI001FE4DC95|nr:diguanylate cyclase [Saccharothrix australiensis]